MINVLATREAYRRFEICGIGLDSGENNPTDGLNKLKYNRVSQRFLYRNVNETQVQEWNDGSCLIASTDFT